MAATFGIGLLTTRLLLQTLGTEDYVIKGTTVDQAHWPNADSIDGDVVAMWYVGPFNGTFDPYASFSVTSDFGLAAGTQVSLLAASSLEAEWVDAGTATVQDNGTIANDADSGMPWTTTLVMVQ